jgi:hypothetical protein
MKMMCSFLFFIFGYQEKELKGFCMILSEASGPANKRSKLLQ